MIAPILLFLYGKERARHGGEGFTKNQKPAVALISFKYRIFAQPRFDEAGIYPQQTAVCTYY